MKKITVRKIDRLVRSDAISKFQENLQAAFADYESHSRSERAKRAWARRKANR